MRGGYPRISGSGGRATRRLGKATYGSFCYGVLFGAVLSALSLTCVHLAGCFCSGSGTACSSVPWCGGRDGGDGARPHGAPGGLRGGLYVAVLPSPSLTDADDSEEGVARARALMDTWGRQASSVSLFVTDSQHPHHPRHQHQKQKQIPRLHVISVPNKRK
jgi:hypothetical protein